MNRLDYLKQQAGNQVRRRHIVHSSGINNISQFYGKSSGQSNNSRLKQRLAKVRLNAPANLIVLSINPELDKKNTEKPNQKAEVARKLFAAYYAKN